MWTGLNFDLPGSAGSSRLVCRKGETITLDLARWLGDATAAERRLLDMAVPPVLDIGCGPGRLAADLRRRGVAVLGIDVAPGAVSRTSDRGVPVLRRSVFDDVPGAGRFGSALLVDGNMGIGGDPMRLLRRVRHLLRPGGLALVEVEPPGAVTRRLDVRLDTVSGVSDWSAWAQVGADDVAWIGVAAGYALIEVVAAEDRWFAVLQAAR
ncbi:MAG: class I SAM-dependent methyltransferase [Egibacteraceae bacterium]